VERKEAHQSQTGMYQYYIKVVRTEYDSDNDGHDVVSNQYSVTEHFRKLSLTATATGAGLPGVYFFYDFASVMMRIEHTSRSWSHFFTTLCAVVGGVFTVMGLLDGFLEKLVSAMSKRQRELGHI
jgi:endoplasmic reticulum-Golgi intermediate compartment protein 3